MKPLICSKFLVLIGCLSLLGCAQQEEPMEEPMIMEEPVMEAFPEASEVLGPGSRVPRPGVLTAGDIDDTLNLASFSRYQGRTASEFDLPRADLNRAVRLTLTDPSGRAAPGVSVTLRRPGAREPFYEGVSGVGGRITVFPAVYGEKRLEQVELRAFKDGQERFRQTLKTMVPQRIALPFQHEWTPEFLDLVLVIDTSGSMEDEHEWLAKEFAAIVQQAKKGSPNLDVRYGLVAYRSPGDDYVVRNYGFTKSAARMTERLKGLDATGGAGGPEVAERGLKEAVDLPWRSGRGERLVFIVGDEPPGRDLSRKFLEVSREAARRNVQVFGIGASDIEEDMAFQMRQAAVLTGGRYLFLTDDSGVGRGHGEPDVPCYRVTSLQSLMTRILRSELTGRRYEAAPGQVIRTVGNYRAGICRQ